MAVALEHRYPNEAERANWDIYDDFRLKKPFGLHCFYKNISSCCIFWQNDPAPQLRADLYPTEKTLELNGLSSTSESGGYNPSILGDEKIALIVSEMWVPDNISFSSQVVCYSIGTPFPQPPPPRLYTI